MENLLREEIGELKSDPLLYISKYFQLRKTMVLRKMAIFGEKIMSWTMDTFVGTTNLSSQCSYIMEWVPPCFWKNQEENLPPFLPPPSEGSKSESRSVMSDSL